MMFVALIAVIVVAAGVTFALVADAGEAFWCAFGVLAFSFVAIAIVVVFAT